jgi:hypothetical protein
LRGLRAGDECPRAAPRALAAWLAWAAVAAAGVAALTFALLREFPADVVPAWRSAVGAVVLIGLPTAAATGTAAGLARRRGAAALALAAMLLAVPVAGAAAVRVAGVSDAVHVVQ